MQRDANEGADAALERRIGQILSEVQKADFERVDPPSDLWGRIEAAVGSDPAGSPRARPSGGAHAGAVVEYSIDAEDVLADVGQSWADFARDNGAPELAVAAPGRTLWTYFDGEETRALWRLLVERARALNTTAEVSLRCDAPDARRWFDMTITPEPDGMVHFRSVLVFEEARPPVSLLDIRSARDTGREAVRVCSWCGRAQRGARWMDIEEFVQAGRLLERAAMPPLSHGICAPCRDEMSAELLVPGGVSESET